ncbi:hypothetical protein QMP26_41450 (plasmid) [Enterocloster clostridioformis]
MLVCKKGYEVKPYNNNMGWYLGTFDPEEGANCRLSQGYAPTEEKALQLDLNRCNALENEFCAGPAGCCIRRTGE